ncbi:MAG: hypothetical protein ABS81_02700 [Pseudonocardia sp. SCN 72-86]|nr:MAG: hypothetical protein ABS81_02700 [Pseudonocardia sp. SCN 72-86]
MVILEKDGAIARLILNRPRKHNALTFAEADLLTEKLHEAEADDDIKVIIIKGRGKSFSVGHDFEDVTRIFAPSGKDEKGNYRKLSQRERLQIDRRTAENYMAFQYSMKPVIAQVHGHCVGFGMYIAELVDLMICADDAKFSHAEQRLGLAGNTWHVGTLLLQYGPKKVREMMLFGSEFSGKEAERLGLANLSVPADQLEDTVEDWARRVALNPKDALVMGKAMHQVALDSLGMTQQFMRGYIGHTLGTQIKFEPGEFNFVRQKRDKGMKEAYRERDARFGEDPAAVVASARPDATEEAGADG